jgi:CTP synthase
MPYIAAAGELKTKPTQHSVQGTAALGMQPDVLLCRCDRRNPAGRAPQARAVLQRPPKPRSSPRSTSRIYAVPIAYHGEGLDAEVLRCLRHQPASAPRICRAGDIIAIA